MTLENTINMLRVSDMVPENWFHNLWRHSHNHDSAGKAVIGVLAFEVGILMSRLIDMWQSLSDKEVSELRKDIVSSVGIKKLISENEDYIVQLICAELMYNLGNLATTVARLGKKCTNPRWNGLEHMFNDYDKVDADQCGLELTWKKMESNVKKMERLVSLSGDLYQEMEMLTALEQNLGRIKSSSEADDKNLVDYIKKIGWKQQQVRILQNHSLWNKSYDYAVDLMVRSIFTIFRRIKYVFGNDHQTPDAGKIKAGLHSGKVHIDNPPAALMQSSAHPFESSLSGFSSVHFRVNSLSGPMLSTSDLPRSFSGPVRSSAPKSAHNFHSGSLTESSEKSAAAHRKKIFGIILWQSHQSTSTHRGKYPNPKHTQSDIMGTEDQGSIFNFGCKCRLPNPPPDTLGAAALALHYANIIIMIEKLAAYPRLIGDDARENLYNMLPSSVKVALRARLKPFAKLMASLSDTAHADEWSKAMARILEWLAPLAHNMVRWQSEQSYEHQRAGSGTNVLLVQTLFYADQDKTECAITELLVGLNYVWRFSREIEVTSVVECANSIKFGDYLNEEA